MMILKPKTKKKLSIRFDYKNQWIISCGHFEVTITLTNATTLKSYELTHEQSLIQKHKRNIRK